MAHWIPGREGSLALWFVQEVRACSGVPSSIATPCRTPGSPPSPTGAGPQPLLPSLTRANTPPPPSSQQDPRSTRRDGLPRVKRDLVDLHDIVVQALVNVEPRLVRGAAGGGQPPTLVQVAQDQVDGALQQLCAAPQRLTQLQSSHQTWRRAGSWVGSWQPQRLGPAPSAHEAASRGVPGPQAARRLVDSLPPHTQPRIVRGGPSTGQAAQHHLPLTHKHAHLPTPTPPSLRASSHLPVRVQ